MRIVVLVEVDQKSNLELLTSKLKEWDEEFTWDILTDEEEFSSALGAYKIIASSKFTEVAADLRWPAPSVFLKNPKEKEKVWNDITDYVVPRLKQPVTEFDLVITESQLQQILGLLGQSKVGFTVNHPSGYTVGVNSDKGDLKLTSADIASMLAATWLFKAKGVRLD